ncbi:MAG: hypothetical protein KF886_19795 [Candidatus Hydrogenedentes bacterium]|nr:hypothetical protein [Candidatus Hydrogenedentota bacterium]
MKERRARGMICRMLSTLSPCLALALLAGCPPPPNPPAPADLEEIAGRLLNRLAALDSDADGELSLAEARVEESGLTRAQFGALDANSNGRLSETELREAAGLPAPIPDRDGEVAPGPPNAYSWDGSWSPTPADLPPAGLYDDRYFDGHVLNGVATPLLPPGDWDYVDPVTMQVSALANLNAFRSKVATIVPLEDSGGRPYGWRFDRARPAGMEIDFTADVYAGSSGTDIWDAGAGGFIRFSAGFNTGDGPDVLRVGSVFAADVRTGSSLNGGLRDNDLVIAGDEIARAVGNPAIRAATIHTGPGSDLVFINHMEQAAIDLGNGGDGRTDTVDPLDGDDVVILGGNIRDCRIFGGNGDDVFVWYIDETAPTDLLLANSFFGSGGWLPAVWDDAGTDRLIVVVPDDTAVISGPGALPAGTAQVGIRAGFPDTPEPDGPTLADPFARYYRIAGRSPVGNRQTVFFDYHSASGHVRAGDIYLTAVEELQIGVGPDAKVYRIDDVNGAAVLDPGLEPIREIPSRSGYNELVDMIAAP